VTLSEKPALCGCSRTNVPGKNEKNEKTKKIKKKATLSEACAIFFGFFLDFFSLSIERFS
jgi:hypothetical protein